MCYITLYSCETDFKYTKEWLVDGFSISPLELPLRSGISTRNKASICDRCKRF